MENKKTEWNVWIESEHPIIIAGPCSAETEEQVIQTATQLKEQGISLFRAGVWKPRTRPGSFEGNGKLALPWLNRVQKELGMKVAIEVANTQHVEEALEANIDILWVGARTTTNPFAMQEIADVLKAAGKDIPVFIKNPINPDLGLWIGAIERVEKAGISKIGAIHRGFSSYEKTEYRNYPHWQIPIELRRQLPKIPILSDPSHICGNREMLGMVMQTAMDLDFDGFIIESHRSPDEAWSDASQQVTPQRLKELLDATDFRADMGGSKEFLSTLAELRGMIDVYDNQLISVLSERMKIALKIGKYKKENDIIILQTNRWSEMLERCIKLGEKQGLGGDFVEDIFNLIHLESVRLQDNLMQKGK